MNDFEVESEHTWEVILDGNGNHRKRTTKKFKKGLVEFVVVYYFGEEENRVPLVTYDTAHGFPHRDLRYLGLKDKRRKIAIYANSLEEALQWTEGDLDRNWMTYFEEFRKTRK